MVGQIQLVRAVATRSAAIALGAERMEDQRAQASGYEIALHLIHLLPRVE